jgi:probable HAF family extracellular repeat protein
MRLKGKDHVVTYRSILVTGFLFAVTPLLVAQGIYKQIDVPGASETYVFGLDAGGDMVGYYGDISGSHGFLLRNGVFTTLDVPDATYTYAIGINDKGKIVGGSSSGGFIYDVPTSTYAVRSPAGFNAINAQAINNAGVIVGTAWNQLQFRSTGFELSGHEFLKVPPRIAISSYGSSINNLGDIVGIVGWNPQNHANSFLCSQGNCKEILSGLRNPQAYGINDNGEIVGGYEPVSGQEPSGFVYQSGKTMQLQFPGQNGTFALGVNNHGEVVGFFTDSVNSIHGFSWIPPSEQ